MRRTTVWAFAAALALVAIQTSSPAHATVFHAREEIKNLAFPDADEVKTRNFFLTDAQRGQIQEQAAAKVSSDLVTIHVGTRDGRVLGYAILDTHIVRTLPETFLVVLTPDGAVSATYVMAFYEPLEYMPTDRWFEQLDGQRLTNDLRVGRAIAGVTGSTLSSRAVVSGIRRALALHAVLLSDAHAEAP